MTRGQRGRRIGRAMIALAAVGIFVTAVLFVTAPGPSDSLMVDRPLWFDAGAALGVVGIIVGLVWMVRIHRADPEPDQHAWRYRAKR